MDIILNNTALSYLYCDRAFRYLVLQNNLSKYDNSFAEDGRKLHLFIQQVDSGQEPDLRLLNKPELLNMGLLYQNVRPLGTNVLKDINGKPCIEMRFLFKLCTIDDINYYFTGTIDRIDTDGTVTRVIDHKTTRAMNLDSAVGAWSTSLQVPLYLFAVRNVLKDQIPDLGEYVVGHYHVIGLNAMKFKLSVRVEPRDDLVRTLLSSAAARAHELVRTSIENTVPNGMYFNACKTCVLSNLCAGQLIDLLKEEGDEPYDPRKWHIT